MDRQTDRWTPTLVQECRVNHDIMRVGLFCYEGSATYGFTCYGEDSRPLKLSQSSVKFSGLRCNYTNVWYAHCRESDLIGEESPGC